MLLVLLFAVGATSAQFGFSSLPAVPDLKQHVETLQEGVGHVSDAIGGLPDTSVIPGKEALEQLVTKEWGEFKVKSGIRDDYYGNRMLNIIGQMLSHIRYSMLIFKIIN